MLRKLNVKRNENRTRIRQLISDQNALIAASNEIIGSLKDELCEVTLFAQKGSKVICFGYNKSSGPRGIGIYLGNKVTGSDIQPIVALVNKDGTASKRLYQDYDCRIVEPIFE